MRQFGFLIVLVMFSAFAQAAESNSVSGSPTGGMSYRCDANTNRCECDGVWTGADCKFMREKNCPNAEKNCESILEVCRCTVERVSTTTPKPLPLPSTQLVSPLTTPARTPSPGSFVPVPYPNKAISGDKNRQPAPTKPIDSRVTPRIKSTIIAPNNIVAPNNIITPAKTTASKSRSGTASIINGGDSLRCCDGPGDIIACQQCLPGTKAKILANPGAAKPQAASGLPTGKRQHKPVNVTRPIDKSEAN